MLTRFFPSFFEPFTFPTFVLPFFSSWTVEYSTDMFLALLVKKAGGKVELTEDELKELNKYSLSIEGKDGKYTLEVK